LASGKVEGAGRGMKSFIEENLVDFVHTLRKMGVMISTSEVITALRALGVVDIVNRRQVKEALRSTLIKNQDQQEIFEKAFDSFFAVPEVREKQRNEWEKQKEEEARLLEEAEAELVYRGIKLDLEEEEKLFYSLLPEEKKKRIREFLEASYLPEDRLSFFKPTLEAMVRGSLRYWRQRLGEMDDLPDLEGIMADDEILASITRRLRDDPSLLYKDMKNIKDEELVKAANLLKKLSRKLATKISRRYRLSKKPDKIDLRRSIKANVRYGGLIFELKYKQKKIQKPSLLLICDVSGSMARYTAFIIQFIYGLSTATKNIESFIFAEELEYITSYFKRPRSFEETMAELVAKSKIWGKGTNLGASLATLRSDYRFALSPHTVAIIVSDTKTLEPKRAEQELVFLKKRIRDIIWLNTLPRREWKDFSYVDLFAQHCKMFECYTLAHLEQVIRNQFLS